MKIYYHYIPDVLKRNNIIPTTLSCDADTGVGNGNIHDVL